ncbi:similar to THO2 [Actinidia rufa]|uniref:Similar to THO2 n=1 Tax=Actinidia rufa TaxID=165716 RepID=A0A7J0EX04_9ERIC|nr:similar to THO2 [Actinidia rufa]
MAVLLEARASLRLAPQIVEARAQRLDVVLKSQVTLRQGSEASTQNASAAMVGIIKSLIGHFDLDPNRVFDIVLECFELQPSNSVFLDLIPIFPKLTALLVMEDFIDLDSIYSHLLPKDDEAFEHYNAFSAKRFDEANKIGKINLAATGKDLMDDEKKGDVTIDIFSALDIESDTVTERASELANNQTLGLLTGFLSVNDWYHAHILFDRLAPLNPAEHIQICNELFRLIEKSIFSAYELIRKTQLQILALPSAAGTDSMETNSSVHRSFVNLPKELLEMLSCAGPYLYRDTLLLQKVCRVLRGYYQSALDLVSAGDGSFNPGRGIGGDQTPRLHLKQASRWAEVMSLLPYEGRYRLYGEWETDDERIPMVLSARQTAKLDTRRILKRLAKENLKQLGRMVAKLAHANPMTVLRTIVHQIEAYRDMITPVVDAFKQGFRRRVLDLGLQGSRWRRLGIVEMVGIGGGREVTRLVGPDESLKGLIWTCECHTQSDEASPDRPSSSSDEPHRRAFWLLDKPDLDLRRPDASWLLHSMILESGECFSSLDTTKDIWDTVFETCSRDLVTLGKLAGISMVDCLLDDEVVVQALWVVAVATLMPIIIQWSSLLQALSLWPCLHLRLSCFAAWCHI